MRLSPEHASLRGFLLGKFCLQHLVRHTPSDLANGGLTRASSKNSLHVLLDYQCAKRPTMHLSASLGAVATESVHADGGVSANWRRTND